MLFGQCHLFNKIVIAPENKCLTKVKTSDRIREKNSINILVGKKLPHTDGSFLTIAYFLKINLKCQLKMFCLK